jgi:hypothetical protein
MVSIPGRPIYVTHRGGKVYIPPHDAYHLETLRSFKRQIRRAHPDVNRQKWAPGRTRNLIQARGRWLREEAEWYAQFGLEPPKGGRSNDDRPASGRPLLGVPHRVRSA